MFIYYYIFLIIYVIFFLGISGRYDLILVVDTSNAVGQNILRKILEMFKLLVNQFDVSLSQTRISIISFSSAPKTILRFDEGMDKEAATAVLSVLPAEYGKANLNGALQHVLRMLGSRNEPSRQDVPVKVVVYASDISQDSIEAASLSFDELSRRNAQTIMLMVNDNEKLKEDAISSLPGTVRVVPSNTKDLFAEPFSLLMERVSERPGRYNWPHSVFFDTSEYAR